MVGKKRPVGVGEVRRGVHWKEGRKATSMTETTPGSYQHLPRVNWRYEGGNNLRVRKHVKDEADRLLLEAGPVWAAAVGELLRYPPQHESRPS